jgi:MFS family permease
MGRQPIYAGWHQVGAVMVLQMLCIATVYTSYSVIAYAVAQEFESSAVKQVLGVTVTSLTAGLLSPFLGAAVDRYSLRRLMIGASLWFCTGFFALSSINAMWQLFLVYGVFMAPSTVLLGAIASSSLLSRWFKHYRARAMGIAASGVAVGGLFLPPLLQFLIETLDWRLALQLYGGVLLLVMLPVAWTRIVDQPSDAMLATEPPIKGKVLEGQRDQGRTLDLKEGSFWLLAISLGLIFCGPIALNSNMVPLLVSKGITASDGVFILSVVAGANFGGKLLAAWLGDRLPHQQALAAILAMLGVSAFVFMRAQSYMEFVVAALMVGIAAGGTAPLWSLTLSRIYGGHQLGRAMGTMRLAILPFTLSSVPLLGWVFDRTGSYDGGFVAYMLLAGVGVVFILMTARSRG